MRFTPKRLRKIKKIRRQTRRNLRHRVFKKIRKRRHRHSFRRKRKLNLRRRTLRVQRGGNGKNIARDADQRKAERGRMRGQLLAAEAQKEVVKFLQKDWLTAASNVVRSGRGEVGGDLSVDNRVRTTHYQQSWWNVRSYTPLGVVPFRPVGPWAFGRLLMLIVTAPQGVTTANLSRLKDATVRWNGYKPSLLPNSRGDAIPTSGKIVEASLYTLNPRATPWGRELMQHVWGGQNPHARGRVPATFTVNVTTAQAPAPVVDLPNNAVDPRIVAGMRVSGGGIPAGTTVVAQNGAMGTLTLSNMIAPVAGNLPLTFRTHEYLRTQQNLMLLVEVEKPFTGTSSGNMPGGPPLARAPMGVRLAMLAQQEKGTGQANATRAAVVTSILEDNIHQEIPLYAERSWITITRKSGQAQTRVNEYQRWNTNPLFLHDDGVTPRILWAAPGVAQAPQALTNAYNDYRTREDHAEEQLNPVNPQGALLPPHLDRLPVIGSWIFMAEGERSRRSWKGWFRTWIKYWGAPPAAEEVFMNTLSTTDGGKAWRQNELSNETNLELWEQKRETRVLPQKRRAVKILRARMARRRAKLPQDAPMLTAATALGPEERAAASLLDSEVKRQVKEVKDEVKKSKGKKVLSDEKKLQLLSDKEHVDDLELRFDALNILVESTPTALRTGKAWDLVKKLDGVAVANMKAGLPKITRLIISKSKAAPPGTWDKIASLWRPSLNKFLSARNAELMKLRLALNSLYDSGRTDQNESKLQRDWKALAKYVGEGKRIESLEVFLDELKDNYGIQDEHKRGLRHFIETEAPNPLKAELLPFIGSPTQVVISFLRYIKGRISQQGGRLDLKKLQKLYQEFIQVFGSRQQIVQWLGDRTPKRLSDARLPLAVKINGVLSSFQIAGSLNLLPERAVQRFFRVFQVISDRGNNGDDFYNAVDTMLQTAIGDEGRADQETKQAGNRGRAGQRDGGQKGQEAKQAGNRAGRRDGGQKGRETKQAGIARGTGLTSHQEQELALLLREALQDRGQYDRIQRDITFQGLFTLYVREEVRESLASMFGEKYDMTTLAQTHSTLAGQAAAHKAIQEAKASVGGLRGGSHVQKGGAKTPEELEEEIERLTKEREDFKDRAERRGITIPTEEQKANITEARETAQVDATKVSEDDGGKGATERATERRTTSRTTPRACPVPVGDNIVLIVYDKNRGVLGTVPSSAWTAEEAAEYASGNLPDHHTPPSGNTSPVGTRPEGRSLDVRVGADLNVKQGRARKKSSSARRRRSQGTDSDEDSDDFGLFPPTPRRASRRRSSKSPKGRRGLSSQGRRDISSQGRSGSKTAQGRSGSKIALGRSGRRTIGWDSTEV